MEHDPNVFVALTGLTAVIEQLRKSGHLSINELLAELAVAHAACLKLDAQANAAALSAWTGMLRAATGGEPDRSAH